jgi:transketolase
MNATSGHLMTVEDHYAEGGLGEAVLAALAVHGVGLRSARMLAVNRAPHSGKPDELLDTFGISARHIIAAVEQIS